MGGVRHVGPTPGVGRGRVGEVQAKLGPIMPGVNQVKRGGRADRRRLEKAAARRGAQSRQGARRLREVTAGSRGGCPPRVRTEDWAALGELEMNFSEMNCVVSCNL